MAHIGRRYKSSTLLERRSQSGQERSATRSNGSFASVVYRHHKPNDVQQRSDAMQVLEPAFECPLQFRHSKSKSASPVLLCWLGGLIGAVTSFCATDCGRSILLHNSSSSFLNTYTRAACTPYSQISSSPRNPNPCTLKTSWFLIPTLTHGIPFVTPSFASFPQRISDSAVLRNSSMLCYQEKGEWPMLTRSRCHSLSFMVEC